MQELSTSTQRGDPAGLDQAWLADAIWQPPEIRGFVTREGKLLSTAAQRAWGYIAGLERRYPIESEIRVDQLGQYFFASSPSQPRDWLRTLKAEGLAVVIETRTGRRGGVLFRLPDPRTAGRCRVAQGDAQRRLPGVEPEPPANPPAAETLGLIRHETEGFGNQTEGLTDRVHCDAPGAPPVALWERLESQIGATRVDLWLTPSRWEFGDRTEVYVPNEVTAAIVRRELRAAIETALGSLGYSIQLDVLVDVELRPPDRAETLGFMAHQTEGLGAQTEGFAAQPASKTLAYGNSSGVSVSQPASQPKDFWLEEKLGSEPPVVAAARELYDRIGDWSMIRGTAVRAVISVEQGRLSQAELDALVAERPCDFNAALAELCRKRRAWPMIGFDKSYLKGTHGVYWPRQWDRPRVPRQPR